MKVLIVDDHPENLTLLRAVLEIAGHQVASAFNGVEALEVLDRMEVDAIISDILMPEMDGYRFCHEVRRHPRWRNLPFIIYSATYNSLKDQKLSLDLGADFFLSKPASQKQIAEALHHVTRAGRPSRTTPPFIPPEAEVMKEYSERLVDKLEERNRELIRMTWELGESEKRYSSLFENMTEGFILCEVIPNDEGRPSDFRYLAANRALEQHTGLRPAEVIGLTVRQVDPTHADEMTATFAKVILTGQPVCLEHHSKMLNRRLELNVFQPEPGKLAIFLRDIGERKRIEEGLKLFRTLVDRSNDGFEIIDPSNGRFLDVSEKGCTDLGYAREELLSLTLFDIDPTIHRADWPQRVKMLRESGPMSGEGLHRRKDGGTFPIEFNVRFVQLDRGYLVAVVRNITDRKRAEAALHESEERFREIAENITEVFWITDWESGEVLYLSPAYEKIWGRTSASLYQSPQSWNDATHPEDRERVKEAFENAVQRGAFDEIYRIIRPDGSVRWVHDRGLPILNAEGKVYRLAGIAADVTKEKKLEEQFRQAQKMEAMGTLAGGIAHDFNNILSAINGYAELAKMSLGDNHPASESLNAVLLAGSRAANLVRQILTFSRRQEQQRRPLRLREVVEESLRLLRATIPVTIEFKAYFEPAVPPVLADATQINQVLMNLGTNAWHAMRNRPGRLEIRLESFEADHAAIEAEPRLQHGYYVRLSVSDTGHGMDQATLERIYEPFFTTKGPGEGTGLGLSVVHGIMESHEGVMTVYSKPGQGTTFHLYFPAHLGEVAKKISPTSPLPHGRGKRILYVDDEEPLVYLGQKSLEQLGYKVEGRTNVAQALELVRADPQSFDLVITDLTMPGMTGTDFAGHLQKIRPDLPIILTSGYSANLTPEHLQTMGIRELLLKPQTIQSLANAVYGALSGKPSV